ncbi:hypothetical protein Tco_0541398 [Tanacetum coccineum]
MRLLGLRFVHYVDVYIQLILLLGLCDFGSIPIGACEVCCFSWRGSRVDGRSHLLSGEIASSEANRIIRDSKLREFSFYLVPLSYRSVDVAELQGEGWFEWMRNGHVEVYGYAFWVNECTNGFHRVNEPGVRYARKDDRRVSEGREDIREVFQQRGSGAKRKLSRCGRNQMGNEPILALPKGAGDFVVYYNVRSKDLEACLEKGEGDCLYVAATEGSYEGLYG